MTSTAASCCRHKLGDAEDEITRAVGLTHAQFVQTVLLPQGEFASFLHASTEDKRALLQRLFGTEVLARTQHAWSRSAERPSSAGRRRATTVASAVHAFAGATGLADDHLAELAGHCESGDCTEVTGAVDRGAPAAAGSRLGRRRPAGRRDRRAGTVLDPAAPGRGARRATGSPCAAARRAGAVAGRRERPPGRLRRAGRGGAGAAGACRRPRRWPWPAAGSSRPSSRRSPPVPGWPRTCGSCRSPACERLRPAPRPEWASWPTRCAGNTGWQGSKQTSDRLGQQLAELLEVQQKAADRLAELPARQSDLAAERDRAAAAAGRLTELAAERDRAQARLLAARQAVAAEKLAARNQQLAQELFDAAEGQRARLDALQNSWRASIASELGMALRSGQECVVCGSVEHPKPARPSHDHVSQDTVTSAEQEWRRLWDEVESRRAGLAEQRAELIELQIRADQLTPERARAKLDQASTALEAALAAAARQPAPRRRAGRTHRATQRAGRATAAGGSCRDPADRAARCAGHQHRRRHQGGHRGPRRLSQRG